MSHGFGEVEAVQAFLPDAVIVLFVLLTQLGDTWWLFLLLVSVYLLADRTPLVGANLDRDDGAFLVALGLGAVALTIALKALFGHPRPPDAGTPEGIGVVPPLFRGVYTWAATADGHTLPSGHALGSTVVYGGLALVLNVGTRRRRLGAAAALITVIAASRVIIGVHYVGDILLGVGVGLGFLAVTQWLTGERPGRALLLAVGLAVVGTGLAGYTFDALVALGAALGARITWGSIGDSIPDHPVNDREARLLAWVGLPAVLVLFGLTYALDAVVPGEFAAPAVGFLAAGVTVGVLLATPILTNDYVEGRLG